MPLRTNARSFNLARKVLTWSSRCNLRRVLCFVYFSSCTCIQSEFTPRGCVLPNKEVRGACRLTSGLEAKFGVRSGQVHNIRGKIWEVLSPKDTKVGKKYQFWGQYLKFRGQNLGYLSFIFLEANLGLQQEFQRQNLGPSPPRPPNMEVPPWEFTSGVKDMTFVLTYI